MTPDLDIFRSAQVLVKRHGQDAPIHAAMRADELLEAGDLARSRRPGRIRGVEADRKGGGGIAIQGAAGGDDGAIARKPQMGPP